jgi:tRNA-modifying protein YgfZ
MQTATGVDLDGQYRVLREGAGFVERTGRGVLIVTGADAAGLLQGQLTNDVEALEPGAGCYAALLDRKGHMQADMRVLRRSETEIWLDTEPGFASAVARHMGMYGVGRDAEVDDASGARTITSVIGPRASVIVGIDENLPEHAQAEVSPDGVEAVAIATDVGVDLIVGADAAPALHRALLASGALEVTEAAAEIVRVESGRPRFGKEMTERTIPAEAHINERAVSFTKGCYIGQETVARLHYKGRPNRHLRGLRLSAPAADGDRVRLGDRELGSVGTAVVSPAHGPIGLAILRREAEPGDTVLVGEATQAEVVDPPF